MFYLRTPAKRSTPDQFFNGLRPIATTPALLCAPFWGGSDRQHLYGRMRECTISCRGSTPFHVVRGQTLRTLLAMPAALVAKTFGNFPLIFLASSHAQ